MRLKAFLSRSGHIAVEAAVIIRQRCGNRFVHIILPASTTTSFSPNASRAAAAILVNPFNSVLLGAKVTAMQRIRELLLELEHYQQRTEQEIVLSQHIFNAVTQHMSTKTIPGLDHRMRPADHFSGDLMIYEKSP